LCDIGQLFFNQSIYVYCSLFIIHCSLFTIDEFVYHLAVRRNSIFVIQTQADSLESFTKERKKEKTKKERNYSTKTTICRSADFILPTVEESSEKERLRKEEFNENVPDVLHFDAPRGRLNERIDILKIYPDNHSRGIQYHRQ
jgi:hypothetical protein